MELYHPQHDHPSVSSLSSIRPPPSSPCAFSPPWKISMQLLKKFIISIVQTFQKVFQAWNCVNLELPNPESVYTPFIWPAPIKTVYILWFLCHSTAVNHWSEDNTARSYSKILRICWILFTRGPLSSSSSDSESSKWLHLLNLKSKSWRSF